MGHLNDIQTGMAREFLEHLGDKNHSASTWIGPMEMTEALFCEVIWVYFEFVMSEEVSGILCGVCSNPSQLDPAPHDRLRSLTRW